MKVKFAIADFAQSPGSGTFRGYYCALNDQDLQDRLDATVAGFLGETWFVSAVAASDMYVRLNKADVVNFLAATLHFPLFSGSIAQLWLQFGQSTTGNIASFADFMRKTIVAKSPRKRN